MAFKDVTRSIARRRRLAASGPMPPALASGFSTGQLAALRIVGDECRARGACTLHIEAIAARAGASRTTVQNAQRAAQRLGLIAVKERRIERDRNLPNLITVTSAEWLAWLARDPRGWNDAEPDAIDDFYRTAAWRELRYRALKLHGAACQCCGRKPSKGHPLHVDHIKPRSKFPELALSIENLQVLCEDCNRGKAHTDDTDWREINYQKLVI